MHLQIIAARHTSARAHTPLRKIGGIYWLAIGNVRISYCRTKRAVWPGAPLVAATALALGAAATVLSLATQSPATSKTVSFNDGAESRCIEYSLTAYATRADVADALSAMAESVEAHGCANITFEGL